MTAPRRGFTLVEVLVAMVVASVALALARAILGGVAEGNTRIIAAAHQRDVERSSRQLLRSLLASARTLGPDSVTFIGSPRAMFTRSRCPVPGGWSEPCSITVSIADSAPLVLLGINSSRLAVIDGSATTFAALCYLRSAADGGQWVPNWRSTPDLPLAIGLIVDRDTVIVPVGR